MAIKSLIDQVRIEVAIKAHNCRANKAHRIERGQVRLAVREGLGWLTYCADCAARMIDADIAKLQRLRALQPDEAPPKTL